MREHLIGHVAGAGSDDDAVDTQHAAVGVHRRHSNQAARSSAHPIELDVAVLRIARAGGGD